MEFFLKDEMVNITICEHEECEKNHDLLNSSEQNECFRRYIHHQISEDPKFIMGIFHNNFVMEYLQKTYTFTSYDEEIYYIDNVDEIDFLNVVFEIIKNDKYFLSSLTDIFRFNFNWGNCDVVEYLFHKFKKEIEINKPFSDIFKNIDDNHIDVFEILIRFDMSILEELPDHHINCDDVIGARLKNLGLGKKIFPSGRLSDEFIIECKYEMDVYDFLGNHDLNFKFEMDSRYISDQYEVVRIASVIEDYTDIERFFVDIKNRFKVFRFLGYSKFTTEFFRNLEILFKRLTPEQQEVNLEVMEFVKLNKIRDLVYTL